MQVADLVAIRPEPVTQKIVNAGHAAKRAAKLLKEIDYSAHFLIKKLVPEGLCISLRK